MPYHLKVFQSFPLSKSLGFSHYLSFEAKNTVIKASAFKSPELSQVQHSMLVHLSTLEMKKRKSLIG